MRSLTNSRLRLAGSLAAVLTTTMLDTHCPAGRSLNDGDNYNDKSKDDDEDERTHARRHTV